MESDIRISLYFIVEDNGNWELFGGREEVGIDEYISLDVIFRYTPK